MHFIGVLNTKGGTGKTTLAMCLAVRAARDARVVAVDLDPQASFTDWHGRRGVPDNPELMRGLDRASDAVAALQRTGGYDFVFFDGPPGSILVTEDAVRASTLVLIPLRASGLDLAASQDCISLCQETGTPFLLVLNAKGQHDGRLVEEARALLSSWKLPVAKTTIAYRSQYVNAITTGRTGPEKDRKAEAEIDALWAEVKAAAQRAAKRRARA
jgi:chromosome partitioning protein